MSGKQILGCRIHEVAKGEARLVKRALANSWTLTFPRLITNDRRVLLLLPMLLSVFMAVTLQDRVSSSSTVKCRPPNEPAIVAESKSVAASSTN